MRGIINNATATFRKARPRRGFSVVELLVASAAFITIAGIAFTLFAKQELASEVVQGQVGLNLALRNAVTQLELDLANAGSYYYQGANVPSWPVGVTIVNNWVTSGSSCYTASTNTYGSSCFDQINIIAAANPTTYPAINVTNSTGGVGPAYCSNTRTGANSSPAVAGTAYGLAATGFTLAQTAAEFVQGDQVLFVTAAGNQMTSVVLTANASVSGSAVKFTFSPTLTQTSSGVTYAGYNSVGANDPLNITTCNGDSPCPAAAQPSSGQVVNGLGENYCGGDWIIKLAPITYQVNTSNSSDPILTRTQSGSTSTVMEQVIGFKVGAAIWNSPQDTDGTDLTPCPSGTGICPYNYRASTYNISGTGGTYDQAYNFTLVRAVRVSLIGRTTPSTDPNYKFRNSFDSGPYQVQGTTLVVNPRDMSMNDN